MVGSHIELPEADTDSAIELSGAWNVVALNDPVNLMSYVSMVFRRVIGMNRQDAEKHMMEVHTKGRSVVWSGEREKAEAYAYQLQQWHLTAIIEKHESD